MRSGQHIFCITILQLNAVLWFLIIGVSADLSAQGWEKIYGNSYSEARAVVNADGENLIVAGLDQGGLGELHPDSLSTYVVKMNALGDRIWQRIFSGKDGKILIWDSKDQGFIGLRNRWLNIGGQEFRKAHFFKMDWEGKLLWEYTLFAEEAYYSEAEAIAIQEDGSLAFISEQGSALTKHFNRISAAGELLISTEFQSSNSPLELLSKPGGGYYHPGFEDNQYLEIYELNNAGETIDTIAYPAVTGNAFGVKLLPNGDWSMLQIGPAASTIQIHIDSSTGDVSSKEIVAPADNAAIFDAILLDDGILLTGTQFSAANGENGSLMLKTDFEGNIVWRKVHSHLPGGQNGYRATTISVGGFICVGYYIPFSSGSFNSHVFKTNDVGEIYTNNISGRVSIDSNGNCETEEEETPLADWVITAEKNEQQFFTLSDEQGNYVLPLDTGNYEISVEPINILWEPCANQVSINFPTSGEVEFLNFPIGAAASCPLMTISHSVPTIRPCFERPSYVTYSNAGTDTAFDAYVDISYDSLINPVSSNVPWTEITDNTYRFDLGNLAPLSTGSFRVNLFLDCDATVGASYCIDAHAYPDTICLVDSTGWSGAFLEATGFCQDEKVTLSIQNIGDEDMTSHRNYIIVEDILLFRLDSVELNIGEQLEIPLTANGATFTLIAEQVENAPGYSYPIAIVEGCGENSEGTFSIGFSNQFQLDDENPFLDQDCPVAVNSFDPNDKQGLPIGYSEEHFIRPATPIEYLIRFQNTGTDTAYTVVIRDTLDANLELSSFAAGASSHPYDVEIENPRVLKFTFQNINLPDSIVDLAGSNGFVEFKIVPLADAPLGTVIRNKSGIYFDFNEPVITNEVFHTIQLDFIEIISGSTEHPTNGDVQVRVLPNPFGESAVLEIRNHDLQNYQLKVFNLQGQLIRREKHTTTNIILEKKSLSSGLYLYQLTAADGLRHSGRIIIQ